MDSRKAVRVAVAVTAFVLLGGTADAEHVGKLLIGLAIVIVSAKLFGALFERIKQPAVLGEILAGVVLGNLPLLGVDALAFIPKDEVMGVIAELGVIVLLFEVGLESNVGQMLKVGASAFLVATIGVVTPMALGAGVSYLLIPDVTWHVHVFIGAILTATSVGITARVLKDLGRIQTTEGRIILGAAVIDDVLGLIVLAVVGGIVVGARGGGEGLSIAGIAWIVGKAVLFLVGGIVVGTQLSKVLFKAASWLRVRGLLLTLAIAFCFLFAWLARLLGLAPIVGAFAAGLILDEVHYKELADREEHGLEDQVRPIAVFLVPVFFVITGSHVDLRVFADPGTVMLAGALTVAAIVGKQVCGLAVIEKGLDRLSVGIGMIPRGEVGLIFAAEGMRLKVVDGHTNAAVVVMVFATTLLTPPVLAWSLGRRSA
jgi:Kef-type K+ transport system membrane component KefB